MKCLHCGHCCIYPMVVIIDDPRIGYQEGNFIVKEGGVPCKYLVGDKPGGYSCAVHDELWYPRTPCFSHTQIERGNEPCRLGEYILAKEQEGGLCEKAG